MQHSKKNKKEADLKKSFLSQPRSQEFCERGHYHVGRKQNHYGGTDKYA